MARKGITPIIAIIVLLLITVSLAGLAYTFLSGILIGQIEKSFFISPGYYCDSVGGNNRITIFIKNTGLTTSLGGSDFIIKTITFENGTQINIEDADIPDISPQNVTLIQTTCGGSCPSGRNRIRLSTGATTSGPIIITC